MFESWPQFSDEAIKLGFGWRKARRLRSSNLFTACISMPIFAFCRFSRIHCKSWSWVRHDGFPRLFCSYSAKHVDRVEPIKAQNVFLNAEWNCGKSLHETAMFCCVFCGLIVVYFISYAVKTGLLPSAHVFCSLRVHNIAFPATLPGCKIALSQLLCTWTIESDTECLVVTRSEWKYQ